jgi:hypothetical protein
VSSVSFAVEDGDFSVTLHLSPHRPSCGSRTQDRLAVEKLAEAIG